MQSAQGLFVFLFGLLVGSFLNVCIYRLALEKTIVRGRSYCPSCNSLIPWYLNVPLVSFLFLRGRCRECGVKISPVYPIVELLSGILFLASFLTFGFGIPALLAAFVFAALLVLSVIDYRIQIIPDGVVIFLFVLGFINAFYHVYYVGSPWQLYAIGTFAASVPLLILGLLYEDGIGGGDIKLMAAAGLFAGWKLILLSLFLGSLFGLFYAIVLWLFKQKISRKTAIPFGPFLSLGILTSILAGNQLILWYLSLVL